MANNYYDMTGVLVLEKVTPVIKAVFGTFELDENYPGNGKAYIAYMTESSCCSWTSVLENLQDLAKELGLNWVDIEADPTESAKEVLMGLAVHFGVNQNEELNGVIERCDFNDDATLDSLFVIAKAFNDGHGLKAYKTEAAWYCNKPRLFEFGGCGDFTGSHVTVSGSSSEVLTLGEELEAALTAGNTNAAAEAVRARVGKLLAGIYDEDTRSAVRLKLIQLLSAE